MRAAFCCYSSNDYCYYLEHYSDIQTVVLVVKNPSARAGDVRDMGSTPGSGRSPGGGNGNPLQYSCLENPIDRGTWRTTVHEVTVGQDWSDLAHTHCMCLGEHQAQSWALWLRLVTLQSPNIPILTCHWSSNILCIRFPPSVLQIYILWWELPWWLHDKEPACQCRRCRFDSWGRKIPWRRKWQPTPVFSPVKSQGQRRLAGYSPWGHKEVRNDLATT